MSGETKIDLNKNLKEYLSRNGSSEKKSLLKSVSIESWFSKESDTDNSAQDSHSYNSRTWFTEAQKDSIFPSLSRTQRIIGFIGCICMGLFCFTLAAFYVPVLLLKARKFCLLYTMGSLFLIGSFSLLVGPYNHIKHLFSMERLPFTTIYFGTMFLTLYSAFWVRHTLLTAVCAICQVIALLWYILSYIPGGQSGLYFFSKICTSVVTKTAGKALPV